MTYFGGGCLNIDLHTNILQSIFGSDFIFSTFKQNTLKMSL
jgi:hypothetical protein